MVRLLIVIPSNTQRMTYPIPFINSLIMNIRNIPKEYDIEIKNISGLRIDMERLQAVKYAQDHHFDLLLMCDDDMQFHDKAFRQLLEHWAWDEMKVVCCNYHVKTPPFNSMIWPLESSSWLQMYEKKVYEVQSLATGCILIDMSIFEQLEKPYFKLSINQDGELIGTEDCYFANNCFTHGVRMYCDAAIPCEHFFYESYPHFFEDPYIFRVGEQPFGEFAGWGNIEKREVELSKAEIEKTPINDMEMI